MTTDTVVHIRPLQPGGDFVYVQTPRPDGTLDVQAENFWNLAEENAQQVQEQDVPAAAIDVKSSSGVSGSSISSSTESSFDSSSDSSSDSAGSVPVGTSHTSATRHAGTGTAASGANRMTAAVPANASLREKLRASIRCYHICACISGVLLGAGAIFTLLANNSIPHRDSGYVYPEEIEFDKVMAGIWYGAGAIAGGIGIVNAVCHYRRGDC